MDTTLIKPEDTWLLWAFLAGWAAVSIYLEQTYKWASKVTGAIIALAGALILSNLKIIPTDAPAYDAVWTYVIPLAIPLLLYQANLKRVWNESGRLLILFLISSVGTVAGAYIAFFALSEFIPELALIAAVMTGSYIGGSVNLAALSAKFNVSEGMLSSTIVADNLMMALYFFVLIAIPAVGFFRRNFPTPHIDRVEQSAADEDGTLAASYWQRKEISLKDIALSAGSAFVIVAVSFKIAEIFGSIIPDEGAGWLLLGGLLGDKYLMLTTITVAAVTLMPKFFDSLNGAQEIGTYLIYIFFVVIGVPASLPLLIQNAPLLLVFVFLMVLANMVVTFGVGRLFKFSLEEMIVASNANIGGPTTAAAMAIAKGWKDLIVPVMLVGTMGYIIGNYIGTIVGNTLSGF
ncbi:hypothetical protein AV656_06415 [Bhargavaea cecembensis]|uniref:DUF819 domain-containing protein n=1 Tax=Bhargavaea cecembensis TaxID=394098 RepID=A0A163FEV3_9BACL|nr:DUF819 family protein [Bhargavaea cecembensis]KZE38536.1 hypothetical protein AV656_06415 [Bhargavaea cecembensis]